MVDTEGTEEAPWLTGPIMSRPRDQYISSMFSRNLLTRQISMRKSAYRPRYAPDDRPQHATTTTTTTPLTPPDTPRAYTMTALSLPSYTIRAADEAQDERRRRTSPSRRRWWRTGRPSSPPSSPPSPSSPHDMLLDETTLDRPSIRLYRPDAVPEAVVAAAAAASATATGGLEAKAWRLVLVSGGALARLKTALAGGAAYATGVSSSWPGSLAFFGAPLAAVVCGARVSTNSSSLRGGRRHAVAVGAALHAFRLALAERGLGSCLLHASVARWPLDAVRRALAVPDRPRPPHHRRPRRRRHLHPTPPSHHQYYPPYDPADDVEEDGYDRDDDDHYYDDNDDDDDDGGYDHHHHLHDHRCAANMQILCALAIGYEDADFLVGSIAPVARGATVERSMVWVRD